MIRSASATVPRTRRRYPASTSRRASMPRGSPYPRSLGVAVRQLSRIARAQSARGKLVRSGTPGTKSTARRGDVAGPVGSGTSDGAGAEAGASAPAATRVAEPVCEVRKPSAWSWL